MTTTPMLSPEALAEVLEGHQAIAWSEMCHCRGDADDVPALLKRFLGSEDPDDAKQAAEVLWDAIQYQGSIFEPTPHVVRYLVRALPRVAEPKRATLVSWLTALFRAYTMTEGQGTLEWMAEDDPERPQAEAQFEREKAWVAEVQLASWDCWEILLELLDETGDHRLAVLLPHALVGLLTVAKDAAPANIDLKQAASGAVAHFDELAYTTGFQPHQASLMYATGALSELAPQGGRTLKAALDELGPAGRAVAAYCLAWTDPSEKVARVLAEALEQRQQHPDWFQAEGVEFPWLFGHFRFDLAQALCSEGFTESQAEIGLDALVDILANEASMYTFEYEGAPVLARFCKDLKVTVFTRRASLDERTIRILTAIKDNPENWGDIQLANMHNALEPYGLKADKAYFERLLS